ncbi:fibronectin type III domain-containing protein [Massilia glaciei]|uniref:Fibronectin type-III domain-containing protein n=1 Tax=Massilia glaciei TaxID=1524097 RepID=A0A2U2HJT3_9BURK|nr:DNRLRE domain-containing protein [Massilia glaciei]PWF47712.1 hypothetical protein C7C56_014190 [Massilia glaciei]
MQLTKYALTLAALFAACGTTQAQTVRYLQSFNGLPPNALWDNNLDSAKPTAHPENILVTAGCGQDGSNCLRQVYRHFDGIHKQPASNPVFTTDSSGKVIWTPSDATHSNTATDVIQANIMISGSTTGTSGATATPVPSKAYTLTYKVYFEPGFDFAKGGKLPGLAAKAFDSGCTEDGSAKRSGSSWSVRLMWRANGRVELYSYDQSRPSGSCGINTLIDHVDGEPPYEVPGQIPSVSTKFRFKPSVWYTITLAVKVNDNNAVVYQKDSNGNNVLDGSGDPIPVGGNGAEYLKIDGSDGSSATLIINNVALRDECNGTCPSTVPDSPATWVNALFYSSFHGGNETKRVQCLTTTAPSFSGLTQARYDQLCASQKNPAIFPTLTWNPMTITAARYDDFKVVEGYPGSDGIVPSAPASLAATATSPTQVNLVWIASTDNVGVAGYRAYRAGVLIGSPAGTSFIDTGRTASTAYSYTVKAIDAAGNLSLASNTASATTPAASTDTQAPGAPASLSATATSSSQINLSWSGSTDNVGVTGYRVYRAGVLVGSPTGTTFSNTGLNASTAYSYTVKAIDAAGNLSLASNTAGATTTAAATDTQAPGTPAALSATATSSSQINLSWSGSSDNVGVTGYRVYRAGVLVGSPTGATFSNTGLSASTAYSYTVKAIDAAGNLSLASNTASATTQSGTATIVTLAPTDDAYTRDGSNAANNYGADALLIVKTDSAGANRHSYLKFSLGLLGTINSAKLRVYGSASATTTLTAYQAGDSWTNSGLTWNNAPAAGAAAGGVSMGATAQYYEIDVTPYVQAEAAGDDTATFILKESAGKYTTLNSNNNSTNKPQLKIN